MGYRTDVDWAESMAFETLVFNALHHYTRLGGAASSCVSTQGKGSLLRLDIISGIVLGCGVVRARSKAGAARRYGSHESISHADRGSNGHRS